MPTSTPEARVTGVNGSIVSIEVPDGNIVKNEVAFVCLGEERLKSEVLRVYGNKADLQVFEDTQGVKVGDRVEMTHQLLSATLGPGLLGSVYDGLQILLRLWRCATASFFAADATWSRLMRSTNGRSCRLAGQETGCAPAMCWEPSRSGPLSTGLWSLLTNRGRLK